jgi:hypothetical protein
MFINFYFVNTFLTRLGLILGKITKNKTSTQPQVHWGKTTYLEVVHLWCV